MAVFIALLRAVNVGRTGKLPMNELASICKKLGFEHVRTCIQSGNVVFESRVSEESARARLEQALTNKLGKRIDVAVRAAAELRSILQATPFPMHRPLESA